MTALTTSPLTASSACAYAWAEKQDAGSTTVAGRTLTDNKRARSR